MPRPPRPAAPGLTYHVTCRGNRRQATQLDEGDALRLLDKLARVVFERQWIVPTYCLMPNHLHVVVTTPEPDLSAGMQWLLGSYARSFNDRHGLDGHLFQGRFHTATVTLDAHLLWLHRYLALNPVEAGLCRAPEQYRWSAHAALVGLAPRPSFLDASLAAFDGNRERYAGIVGEGTTSFLLDLVGTGRDQVRLRTALAEGFTQQQIADALGISQATVSRRLARA